MGTRIEQEARVAAALSAAAVPQSRRNGRAHPLARPKSTHTGSQALLESVVLQLETLHQVNKRLQKDNDRMHSELDAGARVQHMLVPKEAPDVPGAEFAWRFAPSCELAGDILDLVRLDEHRVGIYLLDVSGHGTASALLSVTLSRLLSHMASDSLLYRSQNPDAKDPVLAPADVARCLNDRFPMDPEEPQYFTFVYGVLDLERLEFRYVAAGHPGPLVVRDGEEVRLCPASGIAVGLFPGATFEESTLRLQPGDRFFLFSDGVIEAEAPNGETFDTDRLTQCLASTRSLPLDDSLDRVLEDVDRWCDSQGPEDDVSLVGVELPTNGKSADRGPSHQLAAAINERQPTHEKEEAK